MTQVTSGVGEDTFDPTVPTAPMTNVAEYGFEGRFEDWAEDTRYFEYSKAANPSGQGTLPRFPSRPLAAISTSTVPRESSRWTYPTTWGSTTAPRPARR
jgi:hypothetical protein